MNNDTQYRINEGSIDLPAGFHDRSTNIFIHGDPRRSQLNFNIGRDTLAPKETLTAYVDRQIGLIQKNARSYRLASRRAATLGSGSGALAGECVEGTRKEGGQTLHQRQAAFVCGSQHVLIFSATSARPFGDKENASWAAWLASFRPAGS